MSTCSAIATRLDYEMLVAAGATIFPPNTPLAVMPVRTGKQVAAELGGRLLLRYLLRSQYKQFTAANQQLQFVTPTAYAPAETVIWLALPNPTPRHFALFLDPAQIPSICGPRRVRLGGGVEYLLPNGYPASAMPVGWPVAVV
jgi:hypothetical protein